MQLLILLAAFYILGGGKNGADRAVSAEEMEEIINYVAKDDESAQKIATAAREISSVISVLSAAVNPTSAQTGAEFAEVSETQTGENYAEEQKHSPQNPLYAVADIADDGIYAALRGALEC